MHGQLEPIRPSRTLAETGGRVAGPALGQLADAIVASDAVHEPVRFRDGGLSRDCIAPVRWWCELEAVAELEALLGIESLGAV